MFGWRKRNDGFEWREYVRTTILVRRKKRRERLGQAGEAAVRGLKEAGQRGAAAGALGGKALGRGAKAAGQHGAVMSVAGARAAGSNLRTFLAVSWIWICAAGRYLRTGLAKSWVGLRIAFAQSLVGLRAAGRHFRSGLVLLWAASRAAGSILRAGLVLLWAGLRVTFSRLGVALSPVLAAMARGLEPVFSTLRESSVATPLGIVGGVAALGAVARIVADGFDRDALIALLVAVIILGALLAARLANGSAPWLSSAIASCADGIGSLARNVGRLGLGGPKVVRGAVMAVAAVALAAGGWLLVRSVPALPSLPSLGLAASQIEGRGRAVSGDTLRIAKNTVRLDGIEAPEAGQTCLSGRSRRWRCGVSAKAALSRLLRGKRLRCELSGSDDRDLPLGKCRVGDTDIAAALVRGGHVFAAEGMFAPYSALQDEARDAKRGIWRGEANRPSKYRAQKWDEAKRDAPDGCPIKGDVTRGRRVYVLPWSRSYDRVRINRGRGERWFCSEAEALAAGWKPSEKS